MIGINTAEFSKSLIGALIIGAILGVLYVVIVSSLSFIHRIPSLLLSEMDVGEKKKVKYYLNLVFSDDRTTSKWVNEIINVLFVVGATFVYALFFYISLDGVIRFVPMILSFVSFAIAVLALKKYLGGAIEKVVGSLVSLIIFPMRVVSIPLKRLVLRLRKPKKKSTRKIKNSEYIPNFDK